VHFSRGSSNFGSLSVDTTTYGSNVSLYATSYGSLGFIQWSESHVLRRSFLHMYANNCGAIKSHNIFYKHYLSYPGSHDIEMVTYHRLLFWSFTGCEIIRPHKYLCALYLCSFGVVSYLFQHSMHAVYSKIYFVATLPPLAAQMHSSTSNDFTVRRRKKVRMHRYIYVYFVPQQHQPTGLMQSSASVNVTVSFSLDIR